MPIPKQGWKPMDTAPQDGQLFIALYSEYGMKDGRPAMQPVWWMADSQGKNLGWKKYGFMDTTVYCEAWMFPHELLSCMVTDAQKASPVIEAQEFDL